MRSTTRRLRVSTRPASSAGAAVPAAPSGAREGVAGLASEIATFSIGGKRGIVTCSDRVLAGGAADSAKMTPDVPASRSALMSCLLQMQSWLESSSTRYFLAFGVSVRVIPAASLVVLGLAIAGSMKLDPMSKLAVRLFVTLIWAVTVSPEVRARDRTATAMPAKLPGAAVATGPVGTVPPGSVPGLFVLAVACGPPLRGVLV